MSSNSEQPNYDLLKKVRALAERGSEGEKQNARKILNRLIKKYGIDERELDDEYISEHEFRFKGEFEKLLLAQVKAHLTPYLRLYTYKRTSGKAYMECTDREAIIVSIEFDFYKMAWKEDVRFFFEAFIQKHRLFDTSPGAGTNEIDDEKYMRLLSLMNGIQYRSNKPRLTDGSHE